MIASNNTVTHNTASFKLFHNIVRSSGSQKIKNMEIPKWATEVKFFTPYKYNFGENWSVFHLT